VKPAPDSRTYKSDVKRSLTQYLAYNEGVWGRRGKVHNIIKLHYIVIRNRKGKIKIFPVLN